MRAAVAQRRERLPARQSSLPAAPYRSVRIMRLLMPLLMLLALMPAASAQTRAPVVVMTVDGVIGPTVASYIDRVITHAEQTGATAVILEMDTPGGLLESTHQIMRRLLNARVPVVVYISPSGARAGSAGTFITAAAHIAAMAPSTNLGAAHPVDGATGEAVGDKVTNDASAAIRTAAEKRGRNAEWYVLAVRESRSITERQARAKNVVDLIAQDRADLLRQLNGRRVGEHQLRTAGAPIEEIPMDVRERVLHTILHPNVAYLLMLFAMVGIYAELQHPGAIFPGVIGATSLLLALYSMAVLPINVVGLLLIVLGVGLMIADIKVPSHGILTGAGAIAFAIGSFMLVRTPDPFLHVSTRLILAATTVTTLFFAFVVGAGLRAQRLRVVTGMEGMLGQLVLVKTDILSSGKVLAEGELWNAENAGDEPIPAGTHAVVVGFDGFTLKVRKEI